MSSYRITDGQGSGREAFVQQLYGKNRLNTHTVEELPVEMATFNGLAFNINTGSISLTSAGSSSLLYLKNNEDLNLVITAFFYLLGNTNGSGDTVVQVIKNPTSGTLVSGGTSFDAVNRHFGSTRVLSATLLKGSEGSTLTDGSVAIESLFSGVGRQTVSVGAIIIPKNKSVGIKITPPTGNTNMTVQMAMAVYLREEED